MIERLTSRDIIAKSISVVLALVVWLQVYNDQNPVQRKTVAIDVVTVNVPEGREIVSIEPAKVNVTFEGRAKSVAQINISKLKAKIDLSKTKVGQNVLPVLVDPLQSVNVVEISPQSVTVDIDTIVSKDVPVILQVRGAPHEDYTAGKPTVVPETVSVRGPKRRVDLVQSCLVEVDITGIQQQATYSLQVVPKDAAQNDISDVKIQPEKVQVTVPVTALPPAKVVPVQVRVGGVPKAGYKVGAVVVTPETVKFRADSPAARSFEAVSTSVVDVSDKSASFTVPVNLEWPAGVTWAEVSKVAVKVEIVEDIVQRSFKDVPVQLYSLSAGLAWEINPTSVEIVLSGRSDIIAQVRSSDVEAYIDARGYAEGTYDMVVGVSLPDDVNVNLVKIVPQTVKLTLTKR